MKRPKISFSYCIVYATVKSAESDGEALLSVYGNIDSVSITSAMNRISKRHPKSLESATQIEIKIPK